MSSNKDIILVTGANNGIGLELVSLLVHDASNHVILCSRSLEKGGAVLAKVKSQDKPGTVELLQLDVSDPDSITRAFKHVESHHGRLDALVNNAAIGWPAGTLAEQMSLSFATNTTGPLLMVEAFTSLLKRSIHEPRIINVSSGAGTVYSHLHGSMKKYNIKAPWYTASKAALNMVTLEQRKELGPQGINVFLYSPGFVMSGLGPFNKAENGARPTTEGALPIVHILEGKRDGEVGEFLVEEGTAPW